METLQRGAVTLLTPSSNAVRLKESVPPVEGPYIWLNGVQWDKIHVNFTLFPLGSSLYYHRLWS